MTLAFPPAPSNGGQKSEGAQAPPHPLAPPHSNRERGHSSEEPKSCGGLGSGGRKAAMPRGPLVRCQGSQFRGSSTGALAKEGQPQPASVETDSFKDSGATLNPSRCCANG